MDCDYFQEVSKACCVKVVSDQLSLIVDLTGIVDINTEVERLKKEITKLEPMLETYKRKITAKGYEEKVPEDVRKLNLEKLEGYEKEMSTMLATLAQFESML